MRKYLLLVVLLFSSYMTSAQKIKLGFKFSPTISTNRIDDSTDSISYSTDGAGLRFATGPTVDIPITEYYHFSTGILLVSKKSAFKAVSQTNSRQEEYKLQYLQVPLTLKLFTNEVALDKKVYFQIGTSMEFNVKEKPKKESYYVIENFRFFDSSLLVGLGLEYKMGLSTIVYGGFSYSRGFFNTVQDEVRSGDDLVLKNDYIGLDLGVKF